MLKDRIVLELDMKKIFILLFANLLIMPNVLALGTAFDSMETAKEVKLAPKTTNTQTGQVVKQSVKEQKFNSAIVNLDDAQVELRQELAEMTAKYNSSLNEKERYIEECRAFKKEIRRINKEIKNNDKAKKMISRNLETSH